MDCYSKKQIRCWYLILLCLFIFYVRALHVGQQNKLSSEQNSIGSQHYQNQLSMNHITSKNVNTSEQIKKSVIDSTNFYHNDSQIQQIIKNLTSSYPKLIKQVTHFLMQKYQCQNDPKYSYVVLGQDDQSKTKRHDLDYKSNENNQKKIENSRKKQVVITCNVHARELLTTQVCLQFIKYTLQSYGSKDSILTSSKITIFYRGNDQRDKVIKGKDYCIRKDSNDIDINRNFPTNFNFYHNGKGQEIYPGAQPLSQPFSKCLDNKLKIINETQKIHTYVDIHTGQFTLYDSFSSENNCTRPILENVKEKYCPQCRITSLGTQKDDQVANGEIFADVKKRYQAQHSVLLEIYGGYNDNLNGQENCIAIFNPITQKQLNYYKSIWTDALTYFIQQSLKTSQSQ